MAAAGRTVRRLRLRAPSEAVVRRTARVIEDALHTATLPDGGGRMLFVRRLALGRIEPRAEPAAMALAVERAVAKLGVEWRHGAEAGAGEGAVWFRDPLDAHLALALRLLRGPPPDEWFWPLAVPAWRRELTRGNALREIAFSLAKHPEAPAALPRWFGALVAMGGSDALMAALRADDVEPLVRAAGLTLPAASLRRASPEVYPSSAFPTRPAAAPRPTESRPVSPSQVQLLIAGMLRADGTAGVPARLAAVQSAFDASNPDCSAPDTSASAPRSATGGPSSSSPLPAPGTTSPGTLAFSRRRGDRSAPTRRV